MATSSTEICNLALSHLGHGKEIADLETESSQPASAMRRFYETIRDATLRDFPWGFATKIVALGLVEQNPNVEWSYSYRQPSDALMVRRILSGVRNESPEDRVPMRTGRDATGLLIFTDRASAELEYTVRETDPIRFPADFVMAFSLRLAAYAAPRLAGGDPNKLGVRAMQMYQFELSRAQASAANEDQPDQPPPSSFERARG